LIFAEEFEFHIDKFLASLNLYIRENGFYKIYFPTSDIILNVYDVLIDFDYMIIDFPQLFHSERGSLGTKYVYWNDPKHEPLKITAEHLKGEIRTDLKSEIKIGWNSACRKPLMDVQDPKFFCEMQFENSQETKYHK
jgi:hypothetical protein